MAGQESLLPDASGGDDVEVPESPAAARESDDDDDDDDDEGGGDSAACDDPEGCLQAAWALCQDSQYGRAIELLHDGILHGANDVGMKYKMLLQRSEAFSRMCTWITGQSATRSELVPFSGQEPSYYAELARQDAEAAHQLMPGKPEPCLQLGRALFLLEEYRAAKEAYAKGLMLDPSNTALKAAMEQVAEVLATAPVAGRGTGSCPQARAVTWDTDMECTLCMEMLYEPVTTPCGHSFCQSCFARAMDHNRCPMCRVVLHVGRKLPVTVALKNILQRTFPDEYEGRRVDVEKESNIGEDGPLPLFVMSLLLPGERMALNIFEPRYRLMIRRCMEGNRCFAMGRLDPSTGDVLPVACQVEITECQAMPDGRFGIEIISRRRFSIERTWEQDGYRLAQPVYFADTDVTPDSEESQELRALVADVDELSDQFLQKVRSVLSQQGHGSSAVRQLLARVGDKPDLAAVESFSFWAASLSVYNEDGRTDLLRGTSTRERLSCARAFLTKLCSEAASPSSCSVM